MFLYCFIIWRNRALKRLLLCISLPFSNLVHQSFLLLSLKLFLYCLAYRNKNKTLSLPQLFNFSLTFLSPQTLKGQIPSCLIFTSLHSASSPPSPLSPFSALNDFLTDTYIQSILSSLFLNFVHLSWIFFFYAPSLFPRFLFFLHLLKYCCSSSFFHQLFFGLSLPFWEIPFMPTLSDTLSWWWQNVYLLLSPLFFPQVRLIFQVHMVP